MKIIKKKEFKLLTALGIIFFILTPVFASGQSDEKRGEHSSASEENSEHSRDAEGGGEGEESGTKLKLSDTYDFVRNGSRTILKYDSVENQFYGTVENISGNSLSRVRVEIHLDNGIELGPTKAVNLGAGKKTNIVLKGSSKAFSSWSPHAEVGTGEGSTGGENSEGGHSEEGSRG